MSGMDDGRIQKRDEHQAMMQHVSPFVAWVLVMQLPLPDPVHYLVQTAVTLGVLAWARPWRYYGGTGWRVQGLACLVGIGVFVVWVGPESAWLNALTGTRDAYLRYAVRGAASPPGPSPYAPDQCGWAISLLRLAGSAFVIAVAEEYFWRGFLLRWMKGSPFLAVEPSTIGWCVLVAGSVVFGLEHSRWLVGVLAGLAFGWLYLRTRDLSAAITAHVTTNLLLGLYVLGTGRYGFW